nr:TraX family protein [Tissierella sp.]
MNVFILKLIALMSMIIDHYGAIFKSGVSLYRIIGRLAFPIYAFLLVEGYFHTKNVKKYGIRLIVFAFISELPYDLAFRGRLEFMNQNIFFTLFIGLVTMYFIDQVAKENNQKLFFMLIGMFVALILSVDYSFIGIGYILFFYFTRSMEKNERIFKMAAIMFLINLSLSFTQQYSIFALFLIYFYNEELGTKNKFVQILFYIIYPLHLLAFYLYNM